MLCLKSDVYRVKRKGESTVPCGAPILQMWSVGEVVDRDIDGDRSP